MVRRLAKILIIVGGLAVAACNTVRGAGEDLKSVADAVDEET